MEKQRISWLDGFRAIAVISVMVYHLTSPFKVHKPDFFSYIFRYGSLGVQLFFMISGFVISYTLQRTTGFWAFHVNRFARLFPAMLLCSLLTYGFACWIDYPVAFPRAHFSENLLPGLTFINPQLWSLVFRADFHWINGSYWTLWTEVQFYLLASIIYFTNKRHFLTNLLIIGIALSCLKYLPGYGLNNYPDQLASVGLTEFFRGWNYTNELFNLCFFIGWFLMGALFYRLYAIGWSWRWQISFILVFVFLVRDNFYYFSTISWSLCAGLVLFCSLFFWLILRKQQLRVPGDIFFRRVGVISYSMYLIHEDIGLLLINHFNHVMGSLGFLAPFVVIMLVVGFAEFSFRWYERATAKFLKQRLIRADQFNDHP